MRSSDRSKSSPEFAIAEMVAQRAGREWCLFLDRDGVINRRIVGDYVRSWEDFELLPGVSVGFKSLRDWAPHLAVVTNQQGVGKGLMRLDDVADVHRRLQSELAMDGVSIDDFLVCPHLASADCPCRKPKAGLVLDWLRTHPDVDPALSVMVGDSLTDLEMASNVASTVGGCASIYIGGGDTTALADASFVSLFDLADTVEHVRRGL